MLQQDGPLHCEWDNSFHTGWPQRGRRHAAGYMGPGRRKQVDNQSWKAFFFWLCVHIGSVSLIFPVIICLSWFCGLVKTPMRWSAKKWCPQARSTCAPTPETEIQTRPSSWSNRGSSRPPSLAGSPPGIPQSGVWVLHCQNAEWESLNGQKILVFFSLFQGGKSYTELKKELAEDAAPVIVKAVRFFLSFPKKANRCCAYVVKLTVSSCRILNVMQKRSKLHIKSQKYSCLTRLKAKLRKKNC